MNGKPLIKQLLHLRNEFMGYLSAITREAELTEEMYQNAAIVIRENTDEAAEIRNLVLGQRKLYVAIRYPTDTPLWK